MSSLKKLHIRDVVWETIIADQFSDLTYTLGNWKCTLCPSFELYLDERYPAEGRIKVKVLVKLSRNCYVSVWKNIPVTGHFSNYYEKEGNTFQVKLDNEKVILENFAKNNRERVTEAFNQIVSRYPWDFLIKISSILAKIPGQDQYTFSANYSNAGFQGQNWLSQYDSFTPQNYMQKNCFMFSNAKYLHKYLPKHYHFWSTYLTFLISTMADKLTNQIVAGKTADYKSFIDFLRSFINAYQYWFVYGLHAEQERGAKKNISDLKLEEKIHKDILKHIDTSHNSYWMKKSIEQSGKVEKIFAKLVKIIA